jgi:hypothetical protein
MRDYYQAMRRRRFGNAFRSEMRHYAHTDGGGGGFSLSTLILPGIFLVPLIWAIIVSILKPIGDLINYLFSPLTIVMIIIGLCFIIVVAPFMLIAYLHYKG